MSFKPRSDGTIPGVRWVITIAAWLSYRKTAPDVIGGRCPMGPFSMARG